MAGHSRIGAGWLCIWERLANAFPFLSFSSAVILNPGKNASHVGTLFACLLAALRSSGMFFHVFFFFPRVQGEGGQAQVFGGT